MNSLNRLNCSNCSNRSNHFEEGDVDSSNNKIEYRATFKSMFGLAVVLSIMAFLLIGSGIFYKNLLVVPGILLFALLILIRFRFKIVVDDNQIEYTGFFSTKVIKFSDIIHAGWMFEHGYTRDRYFGSAVYEILTTHNYIRINFRLFPMSPMSKVIEMLESLPGKSTTQND
jgi:hypothetical protein